MSATIDAQALARELYGSSSRGKPTGSLLSYYLGVLRRRVWVIAAVVVIATTIGILKAATLPKIYEARTRLLVERDSPQVISFSGHPQEGAPHDAEYYTTQTELMHSRAVLELALAYPDVREPLEIGDEAEGLHSSFLGELKRTIVAVLGATPAPPEALWERLRKKVFVEHIAGSHFIEVRVRSKDAVYAVAAANAVAAAFQQYHLKRQAENLSQDFILLQKEKEREEQALFEAEQELQAFREKAQGLSASVSPQEQPVIERLLKLNEQLTSVQLRRIELASQIAVMKDAGDPTRLAKLEPDARLFSIPIIQGNDVLMSVRKALIEAEKELGVLSTTYGAEHPLYQSALTKVELLRKQFVSTLNEIILAQMNRLKMLEQEEAQLQQSVEEQKRSALELAKEAFTLTRLQSAVERHRILFDAIVARMREVNISSGSIRTNVQVVEKASLPLRPVDSGRLRVILVALGIGCFLGCGLGFVFEHLDDTVKTPEDLREKLGLALLGFVPSMNLMVTPETAGRRKPERRETNQRQKPGRFFRIFRRLDPNAAALDDIEPDTSTPEERAYRGTIILQEPVSSIAEAYRSLRANLFYAIPAEEVRVLAVTSCRPREGKTTTAINLALAIAQTGKKVLLVDADLHRPTVDSTLSLKNETGLTSVLVGEKHWREITARLVHNGQPVENLEVLTAGPPSPNPSELLVSKAMKNLLAEARQAFEWVIVDTPPVLFVSDATVLGAMCDGVLLVVKADGNTRSLLIRAREQLHAVRARIVGAVLNDAVLSVVGRYYSTYYAYGYSRYARGYRKFGANETSDRSASGAGRSGSREPALSSVRQEYRLAALERAALEKAGAHSARGDAEQASIILEELVELKPDLLRAWEMLIALLTERGDTPTLEEYVKRLESRPQTHAPVLIFARGCLALLHGDKKSARQLLTDAHGADPESAPILEALARLELAEGQTDAAFAHAQRLLNLASDNAWAHCITGLVLLGRGDHSGAEAAFKRSLAIRKIPEALNGLARVLLSRKAYSEAEELAREGLKMSERNASLWDTLGAVLMDTDRLAEAQQAIEKGLEIARQDAGLLLRLAEVHIRKGQWNRAMAIVTTLARRRGKLGLKEQKRLGTLATELKERKAS